MHFSIGREWQATLSERVMSLDDDDEDEDDDDDAKNARCCHASDYAQHHIIGTGCDRSVRRREDAVCCIGHATQTWLGRRVHVFEKMRCCFQ